MATSPKAVDPRPAPVGPTGPTEPLLRGISGQSIESCLSAGAASCTSVVTLPPDAVLADGWASKGGSPLSPGGARARPFGGLGWGAGAEPALAGSLGLRIRECDKWDDDGTSVAEEDEASCTLARTRSAEFSCARGSGGGVTALSFTALSLELEASASSSCRMDSDRTGSQPVVRGAELSWIRGEVLGRGSLGTVYRALNHKTGETLAVKEVFIKGSAEERRLKEALQNELNIVRALSHPRIVRYLGHDEVDSCLFIYLEYMPGGSLAQVLAQFGAFEETLVQVYTKELLEGLEYLHTREPPVVHRDVKGANVLVGIDCRAKLADFGCSKRTGDTLSRSMKGSIAWMAPEVINETGYGRRADVWSFGCVVIEMASAEIPWQKFDNPMAAMVRIGLSQETPPIPPQLSDAARGFVARCIQRDPATRPTATELFQLDFVRDLLTQD